MSWHNCQARYLTRKPLRLNRTTLRKRLSTSSNWFRTKGWWTRSPKFSRLDRLPFPVMTDNFFGQLIPFNVSEHAIIIVSFELRLCTREFFSHESKAYLLQSVNKVTVTSATGTFKQLLESSLHVHFLFYIN